MTATLATAVAPVRSHLLDLRDLLDQNAWLSFVVFILVATFTMFNLFIAIIVNAVQRYIGGEAQNDAAAQGEAGVREELRALRAQIERLSASLAAHGGREEVSQ